MNRFPFRTLTLAGLTVLVHFAELGPWLVLEPRLAAVMSEPWRMLTAHLVHWSADHLFWDVLTLVVLGTLVERQASDSRRVWWGCVLGGGAAISLSLLLLQPDLPAYAGLSGIDSALFTAAAAMLARRAIAERDAPLTAAACVAGLLFLAKLGYEARTGSTLFADHAAAGFTPVPLAHLVGGAAGLATALLLFKPLRQGTVRRGECEVRREQGTVRESHRFSLFETHRGGRGDAETRRMNKSWLTHVSNFFISLRVSAPPRPPRLACTLTSGECVEEEE